MPVISSTGLIVTFFIGATTIVASPVLASRAGVTSLNQGKVAALKPYALLARAAYCDSTRLKDWSCGPACNDLQGMKVAATNDDSIMDAKWFVGYYPKLHMVVVSNRGTDPNDFASSLTDVNIVFSSLDPTLFPGVPSKVQVHDACKMSQEKSAAAKLTAVNALMQEYNTSTVTITGLGRGGTVSLIDAVYLPLHLPPKTNFKVVTHGTPRVGNQAFADYIDSHLSDVSRITNKRDPFPVLPQSSLGFHHASGEKHIDSQSGEWFACPDQDNADSRCSVGEVPDISKGRMKDNEGPYDGVTINSGACDS